MELEEQYEPLKNRLKYLGERNEYITDVLKKMTEYFRSGIYQHVEKLLPREIEYFKEVAVQAAQYRALYNKYSEQCMAWHNLVDGYGYWTYQQAKENTRAFEEDMCRRIERGAEVPSIESVEQIEEAAASTSQCTRTALAKKLLSSLKKRYSHNEQKSL